MLFYCLSRSNVCTLCFSPRLLPAFYNLAQAHLLPEEFAIVGFARSLLNQEQFRLMARENTCLKYGMDDDYYSKVCNWVIDRLIYVAADCHEADPVLQLKETLSALDHKWPT